MVITIGFGLWFAATTAYTLERHVAMAHQSPTSLRSQQRFQLQNLAAMPQENIHVTDPVKKLLPPARAGSGHSQQSITEKWVLDAIASDFVSTQVLTDPIEDYRSKTVTQLRKIAKDRKIKNISRMTRAQRLCCMNERKEKLSPIRIEIRH